MLISTKTSKLNHRSIESTRDARLNNEHSTPCPTLDSDVNEKH